MEGTMGNLRPARFKTAIFLIFFTILVSGRVGGQALQQEVKTEYLLGAAGFQRWDVNEQTPKRRALLDALPQGKISTYVRDGEVYHAYPGNGPYLFVGDEAAYQNYLSLSRDRKMCERVTGGNQVQFWTCMDEYQQSGARQGGK
jgi:hypothetical protein